MSVPGSSPSGVRFDTAVEQTLGGHTKHRLAGKNLRIANVIHPPIEDIAMPAAVDHVLVYHYKASGPVRRFYGNTESGRADRLRTGGVLPAHRATRWICESSVEVVHFYLDDNVLCGYVNDTLGIDPSHVEIFDDMNATDRFLAHMAPIALIQLHSPTPVSQLMVDGFEQLIAAHLIDTYSNLSKTRPRPGGKLDAKTVARIHAHIAANLDDRLSLADLAAHTSMSVFEFARAFKGATGTSPHQALLEHRVARVQDLIQNTELSLAEIAYACGFSSQAHMTTTFAKHMGVTPGRYRKEISQ